MLHYINRAARRRLSLVPLRASHVPTEKHVPSAKYKIGQTVSYRPARASIPTSSQDYKILRLLPREGQEREQEYQIKSGAELFERVAKESELSRRA